MSRYQMRIDPEFQELISPLSLEERALLEQSILNEGCRDALVIWQGKILDGHTRYEICKQHDIEFQVMKIDLPDRNAAKIWIIKNQLARRNLTLYQRCELAQELEPLVAKKAKKRMLAGKKLDNPVLQSEQGKTVEIVAKLAGVGKDTIYKAKYISDYADDKTKEDLRRGKSSINLQFTRIRKEKQRAAYKDRKAAVPEFPDSTERFRLICGDLAEVGSQVDKESVDWIITDPPYAKKYLHLYSILGEFAVGVLKYGGSLIVMVGHFWLPEVINKLNRHLSWHWCCAYIMPGATAQIFPRKVRSNWKPLLWFVKGEYKSDWIPDIFKSEAPDKRFHEWGQSESGMADIVERFTSPGETICDPFLGSGTTGVVALKKHRLFIGIDCDPNAIEISKERFREILGN